jgi:hypothetical protein
MSEYQLYEFQSLDRSLSSKDQTYIHTLSSRVQLTATSARFTYNYGDFPGKPEKLLERCFDIMLYVASYGIRQLMIRLPKGLVDAKAIEPYCLADLISVTSTARSLILNINIFQDDYCSWIDDDDYLNDFVSLREALLKGDFRVLYLAWLAAGFGEDQTIEFSELVEPPVPAGLQKLSPALRAFANLFVVEEELIAAAAAASPAQTQSAAEPIADWLTQLSEQERNAYLLRVVNGETHVGAELKQYLQQKFGKTEKQPTSSPGRTLAELMAIADGKQAAKVQKATQKAAQARQKYLKSLSPQVDQIWQTVDRLIAMKQPKRYDEALVHLVDLHDLAVSQGALPEFQQRIQVLKQQYSTRPALMSRLRSAGLT